MPNSRDRSMRLLELYILLTQESNADHPITVEDMRTRLAEIGLPCSRRSVYEDLEVLGNLKVSLLKKRVKNSVGYYSTFGSFTPGELETLFDAVQACCFVSPADTDSLIKKIAGQSGCYDVSEMLHSMIRFNTRKQENPEIFRIIETCAQAAREQKQLTFRYFHYDFSGEKEYDYEGQPITAEPYFLVFYEDWFYLIAWAPLRQEIRHYRIDRISKPEILPAPLSEEAAAARPDPEEYTKRYFRMFGGEETEVTLEFDRQALSGVYDKYGTDLNITMVDENTGRLTRSVSVSPIFFSWVCQFSGAMRITAPASVRKQYKAYLRTLLQSCK